MDYKKAAEVDEDRGDVNVVILMSRPVVPCPDDLFQERSELVNQIDRPD